MTVRVLVGDCRVRLREFPDNHFHCCVTSPPYWGLRDYNIPLTVWGGDPECEHKWGDKLPIAGYKRGNKPGDYSTSSLTNPDRQDELPRPNDAGQVCQLCGAWLGNLGLEPSPELYIQHIVETLREVWRVLRDDGTMWLKLGDCYMGSGQGWQKDDSDSSWKHRWLDEYGPGRPPTATYNRLDIKPKDLVGIPCMVVLALRDDGWYWRQAIPWVKDNPS